MFVWGRERKEESDVWLWETYMQQPEESARAWELKLQGGKMLLCLEEFTPSPLLLKFRLGRLSLTLMKQREADCEEEAEHSLAPCPHTLISTRESCCSFGRLL